MSSTNALKLLRENRPNQLLLSEKKAIVILEKHGSLSAHAVGKIHGFPFGFRTVCARYILDRMARNNVLIKESCKKRNGGLPSYRLAVKTKR